MPQAPDWKHLIEVGMQFTEMRRSQAREVAAELVAQGQLARDQMAGAVDELVAMSKRRTEELRDIVRHEVQRQLGAIGLATKEDLARLERRLSGSPARAAKAVKKAPAKKAPAKKAPAKKAAAKKAG